MLKCFQTTYSLTQFHLITKMTVFCKLMKELFRGYLHINKQNIKRHANILLRNNHQLSHLKNDVTRPLPDDNVGHLVIAHIFPTLCTKIFCFFSSQINLNNMTSVLL